MSIPDKEAWASLFSRTSGSHDVAGFFRHFGTKLVDRAGLRGGDHVLDVAAGTGASLLPAAQRVGSTGRVVGVDLAPGMVDRLGEAIEAGGVGNAQALVADAEALPFADESFDVVLCGFGLFFFPNTQGALAEFRRVLRPHGVLALSTFTRLGSASMDSIWQRISDFIAVPPPAAEEMRFHEPAQLVGALGSAGFVEIEVEESPFEVVLPDFDAWWSWLGSMEFSEYLERMSPATLQRFRRSAAVDLGTEAADATAIRFPMDALLTRGRKVPAGRMR